MTFIDPPTTRCRLGLARCDITPPVGIYHRMWGAATHERATGVHRPLTATALVLHPLAGPVESKSKLALIAVDHCLFWAREMDELLAALADATGLARERIIVAFSHTHAGGLMGLERASLPGGDLIAPYLKELAARLSGIIRQADQTLAPVTITYGQGRCSMAGQRDFWDDGSQQFVCGFNPQGDADDTVLVARISAESGKCIGTLVNYACHPTTLAWQNTLISPDYVGALREVVEAATGAPCAFFQGASGDLGPRESFVGDPAVADRNGRQLGYAVLAALEALSPPKQRFRYLGPVVSGATLGAWTHEPIDEATLQGKERWQVRKLTIPQPYRAGLQGREETEKELLAWRDKEEQAQRQRDQPAARDAHAMIERCQRRLTRIRYLPEGSHFPLPGTLLRLGDAIWLCVEGEHYQWLQRHLRARFPTTPLWVTTLANGSRCSYLPTADTYGKGIYQESIAVLEKGSLEHLAQSIAIHVQELFAR